ncbi:MAG: SIS domain-containing protein [Myxococcales bacterium]|nr:SIS domain-containing protein [Myxococcales bacterium]
MCGVIGLIYERARDDLGEVAADLLKTLEYRGYDSTGAAIQGTGDAVDLRKDVGAPSVMVHSLGITKLAGQIMCGQVRWATFGAVDQPNSQPHVVRCHTYLYGAHNGNVTNCDSLKVWLSEQGHEVRSDNDGEMVVHTVEHFFARELETLPETLRKEGPARRQAMRRAVVQAGQTLKGSYAAVIVDPVSRGVFGIKRGSSFYFGVGEDPVGGRFGIASSDLSSVLKLTRVLVPMSEGDFVEFDAKGYAVYRLMLDGDDALALDKKPVRSRLRAKDTALLPPFETFIDQEIHAQEETSRNIIRVFSGGTRPSREIGAAVDSLTADERQAVAEAVERLQEQYTDEAMRFEFEHLLAHPAFGTLMGRLPQDFLTGVRAASPEALAEGLASSEAGFFADLLAMTRGEEERVAVRLLDALLEREEVHEFAEAVSEFSQRALDTIAEGGRIFLVCCGTSFHAAKAASLFFNELASTEVLALLPGEFRGQYAKTLRDGDLFVGISQSGETKDLIDVLNDAMASGRRIGRVGIVNNVNSTLAQEKSEVVIPLHCGPEIAVPATKSFINQLTVFYGLAVRLAERRLTSGHEMVGQAAPAELAQRNRGLHGLPELIKNTLVQTDAALDEAASLLYLTPSMHLLATRLLAVAKEGALKVRETVLNHTEGFEASEFKHGPNTILGINTVFGTPGVDGLLKAVGQVVSDLTVAGLQAGLTPEVVGQVTRAVCSAVFDPDKSEAEALAPEARALFDRAFDRGPLFEALYQDYPLVYITGPDDRDVSLTVSQIHTHKIRGALPVMIAEEDPRLRAAIEKPPADRPDYRSVYVALPLTGDTLQAAFSASVALQLLALRMSVKKMAYLESLGLKDHGVHPDVPKNVSKSITVD